VSAGVLAGAPSFFCLVADAVNVRMPRERASRTSRDPLAGWCSAVRLQRKQRLRKRLSCRDFVVVVRGILVPALGAVRSFTVRLWLSVSKFKDGAITELFSSYGAPTAIEGTTKAAGASLACVRARGRAGVWADEMGRSRQQCRWYRCGAVLPELCMHLVLVVATCWLGRAHLLRHRATTHHCSSLAGVCVCVLLGLLALSPSHQL
jgi:hypothetical protein